MSISELSLQQLQQIPVLALRELVNAHLDDPTLSPMIHKRFQSVLHRKPRDIRRALLRLTREHLTMLIVAIPEITNEAIAQQFEEHRYGTSPSFFIYLFEPDQVKGIQLAEFHECFKQAIDTFNVNLEEGLPNIRRVVLNDLGLLKDQPEIIEASYRFQSRLDFIDENEIPVSPYETLYGFFWLNKVDGYVILQARHPEVLKAVKEAIESSAGTHLTALVITKRFKNALAFLQNDQIRSVKFHDPMPDSTSFRWLSISDDNLYKKDYARWEGTYPEVRSARYRTFVEGFKETMVTIRCDQGALSLAGAVPASMFRNWCLKSLGEVIRIHRTYQADAAALIPTLKLANKAEMNRFTSEQKNHVLNLITALMIVKSGAEADISQVPSSPLDLAISLGSYVVVQVPYQCKDPGCDYNEELLVTCDVCGKSDFILQRTGDNLELVCREHRNKRWMGKIPLLLSCPNDHRTELGEEILADVINIVPGPDLLTTIATVTNSYLKGYGTQYRFDLDSETFIVRGNNLWYFPDRGKAFERIRVIQNIGTVASGGQVIGVKYGRLNPGNRPPQIDTEKHEIESSQVTPES